MDLWAVQSCRACLLQDNASAMYDLAVPDTLKLFNECANMKISLRNSGPTMPQHLCGMCYRLCELMQGFRERCQETEQKLIRIARKNRKVPKSMPVGEETEMYYPPVEADEEAPVHDSGDEQEQNPLKMKAEWIEDNGGASGTVEIISEPPKKKMKDYMDQLQWGPGPNTKGVWMHFLRDTTKKFARCMENDCQAIIRTTNMSTTGLRLHLLKVHQVDCPTQKDMSLLDYSTDSISLSYRGEIESKANSEPLPPV